MRQERGLMKFIDRIGRVSKDLNFWRLIVIQWWFQKIVLNTLFLLKDIYENSNQHNKVERSHYSEAETDQ
jgi:hypothetical protein